MGLVLAVGGFWSVFVATRLRRYLYGTAAPLSLALGVLLLVYAVQVWRSVAGGPDGAEALTMFDAVHPDEPIEFRVEANGEVHDVSLARGSCPGSDEPLIGILLVVAGFALKLLRRP